MKKKAITIQFPAPLPADITCPICEGNKCKVCEMSGKIKLVVDAKVPIQKALIVKYVANNINSISSELSKNYGLVPEIETMEIFEHPENRTYEIIKISSLGGVVYIATRVDSVESIRTFTSLKDLNRFKEGWYE
jgi:hypothetical protein|tara:strand:- start:358 stop:759 length:402 start_codon:yes stop_codon:yes gene_type:complete